MTLRLNGTTSGYVEIDSASTGGNNTIVLPSSNGSANQFLKNGSTAGTLGWSSLVEDASGRLLVGASSSRSGWFNSSSWGNPTLQVEGTSVFNSGISVTNNSNDDNGSQIFLGKSRATSVGGVTVVSSGDNLGRISFQGADGSELVAAATIECNVDATPGTNDMPGRLVFSTTADGASSPTERMRIRNEGLILTYSTGNGHVVNVSAGAGTSTFIYAGNRSSTDTQGSGGTTVYYVYSNGNVQNTNGSYTALSDAKLKENIVDAGSQWSDLKAIQIRNWNFKEETGHETHRQIGPIAQELETVCPGLVFETPDRDEDGNDIGTVTKGVNQSVLYMKAVKALQEAMERIETLEAANAALETRLAALEAQQ